MESQIFAWVLHFRQLSYKLDYRENQTGVQRLKNIQEDIKTGKFKQAYLLYGEEAYLKQQYKRNLVKALNPDDDTMNFTRYEGKGIDGRELLSLCDTMPFFAERRVVLLEDTGFFKNKCEELADYMKALPDYLYLVFCESEVDKRSRMYKAVKACGSIGEFKQQDEKTLMRWAAGILGKNGRRITQRDVELLLTMTGTDMGNIRMELEKLISYTVGRDVVTAADIQAVCTTQTTNKIFDMVRAVTEKNQKRALDLYYDLLIGMDTANIRNMTRIAGGSDSQQKIFKMLSFADYGTNYKLTAARDVADPWYTGDFDATFDDVISGCRGLLEYIKEVYNL